MFSEAVGKRLRRRKRRRIATLCVAAVGLFVGSFVWRQAHIQHPTELAANAPVVLAPATKKLPDGSTAELRDKAAISTAFSSTKRQVSLQSGEAYFSVAKDATRPFVVVAGGVEFRAVGTAFLVSLGEEGIELLVTEGAVAVAPGSASPGSSLTVTAGHKIVVGTGAAVRLAPALEPVGAAELAQRLAWRVPRLEFSMTPLGEVLKTFGAYAGLTFELGDAQMAKLEMTGVLRTDDIETMLTTLEAEFRVKATRQGNHVLLRR